MERNLYLNAAAPQFLYNLSMNSNSHCNLHCWKVKIILKYFRRPLLIFPESLGCCTPEALEQLAYLPNLPKRTHKGTHGETVMCMLW